MDGCELVPGKVKGQTGPGGFLENCVLCSICLGSFLEERASANVNPGASPCVLLHGSRSSQFGNCRNEGKPHQGLIQIVLNMGKGVCPLGYLVTYLETRGLPLISSSKGSLAFKYLNHQSLYEPQTKGFRRVDGGGELQKEVLCETERYRTVAA